MADPKDGEPVQTRRTQTPKPAAPEPRASGGEDSAAGTVAPRRRQYLIGVRPLPGVAPVTTDLVLQALNVMEDVEVLRRLRPRGLQTLSAGAPGTQDIIVARIDGQRGEALRQNAPPNLIVERDAPLDYGDALLAGAWPLPAGARIMPLLGRGNEITFRVMGEGRQPVAGASVFVYGAGLPAQAVTDTSGSATVTVYDADIPTAATAVYVKPAADHWDRVIANPALTSGGVNVIELRPFNRSFPNFPGERLHSWGQRLMSVDPLGDGIAGVGAGVAIGLVDSGCDNTHPLLRHVAEGADMTTRQPGGWTTDVSARGTHAAGIIAGNARPPQGIESFAPGATLHVFKLFPGGRFSDLIDALDQAIERRLDLVTISLGSDEVSELVSLKLVEARQRGVAVVAAAGNSGGAAQFPALVPGVLAVGAIGKLGEFPSDSSHAQSALQQPVGVGGVFVPRFSSRDPRVAVAAPGVAVISAVPGGGYAAWDGSSVAAAHVTGLAAILLSSHPLFRDAYGFRGEQRVAALFELLRAAAQPYVSINPFRIGPGVPVLHRVPGWQPPLDRPSVAATEGQPQAPGGTTTAGAYFAAPAFVQQLRAMGMI